MFGVAIEFNVRAEELNLAATEANEHAIGIPGTFPFHTVVGMKTTALLRAAGNGVGTRIGGQASQFRGVALSKRQRLSVERKLVVLNGLLFLRVLFERFFVIELVRQPFVQDHGIGVRNCFRPLGMCGREV